MDIRAIVASMRPQRFSCGIAARHAPAHCRLCGFNEAAAFQLRNRPGAPSAGFPRRCFNEAAAFQLRNHGYSCCADGRGCDASMRPQRFSCGIPVGEANFSRKISQLQ